MSSTFFQWLVEQDTTLSRNAAKDPTFPRTANQLWVFLHYYDTEPENRKLIKTAHRDWRNSRKVRLENVV